MATYKVRYGDTLGAIAKQNGTTVDALLKANPTIKDPNRIYAGADLNLGAPEKVATPTPQPTDTTKTSNKTSIKDKASLIPDLPEEDPFTSSYFKEQKRQSETILDEKQIRRDIRKRLNSEMNALRLAANQKVADERTIGQGQLGSARAIQARSGTLGSNFAGAENDQINRNTQEQVNLINAETEAKIAFLMGEAEKDYSDQITKAREAKKKSADEYITYLNERDSIKSTKATNLAKLFAAQGIDPDTLSEEDVAKLQKTYGLDAASFKTLITEEKTRLETEKAKAAAEALKANSFDLSEGEARYVYDPVTGEAKLVAQRAKTYAPKASGGGSGVGGGSGSGAFSNDLDALVGMVAPRLALNQRNDFYAQMKRARNDEDKIAILSSVVALPGDARNDLINTRSGQNSLKQAIAMVNNGVKTGFLKAGADYAFNVFGGQVDPAMTELKQLIVAAVQPYRSSITGAAWGTQEEAEYRSLFGGAKDTPETLLTKLQNLDRIMTNKRVSIVASNVDPLGVNSSFDSYYVNSPYANPQPQAPAEAEVEVRAPDGRVIMIPESKLDQALQAGYTQT